MKEVPKKSNRFSLDGDSFRSGSLRDLPSHLRSSLASLSSLDLPSLASSVSLEISARDLAAKKDTLCGYLELKRNSGFKAYKKYWCALDGPIFYVFSREKDPKAKHAVVLDGYTINATPFVDASRSRFRSEISKKKGRQFELIPPIGLKDAKLFAANSKEEALTWIVRLTEAIKSTEKESLSPKHSVSSPFENSSGVEDSPMMEKDHPFVWRKNSVGNKVETFDDSGEWKKIVSRDTLNSVR